MFIVSELGIEDKKVIDAKLLPKQFQIDLCITWLLQWGRKRKSLNYDWTSYQLKHVVERWAGTYISNGAFIQAAINLGYKIKRYRGGTTATMNIGLSQNSPGVQFQWKGNGTTS